MFKPKHHRNIHSFKEKQGPMKKELLKKYSQSAKKLSMELKLEINAPAMPWRPIKSDKKSTATLKAFRTSSAIPMVIFCL